MLAETPDVEVVAVSDTTESAPLGRAAQNNYLNSVARIETTKEAPELHERLCVIETALGRVRGHKWGPRTIDLDLVLFGDEVINLPQLTVPHPQMHLRSFVLDGLRRLNGELVHPVLKVSVTELADRLGGGNFMLNPEVPQLISIAGVIGVGKTTLTKKLSARLGGESILEAYDKNPFMPDVYEGKKELALNSQLFFLTSRIVQLNPESLTPGEVAFSDYVFNKELIYARRLLNPQQLALYEERYRQVEGKTALPVLVIYLRDSAERCLEHIRRRNRPYEQHISTEFLEQLSADYEQLFAAWKLCPVIRVSMSQFDCTADADVETIAEQVRNYIAL